MIPLIIMCVLLFAVVLSMVAGIARQTAALRKEQQEGVEFRKRFKL